MSLSTSKTALVNSLYAALNGSGLLVADNKDALENFVNTLVDHLVNNTTVSIQLTTLVASTSAGPVTLVSGTGSGSIS